MAEKTRVVSIQLTLIDDESRFNTTADEAKAIYEGIYTLAANADQVLVDVKDFVWDAEGGKEDADLH